MKNRLFLLGVLLLLALFSAAKLPYTLFYLLAAAAVLCYVGSEWVFRQVRVERRISSAKAFIGQELTITVTAVNRRAFPLGWAGLKVSVPTNFEQAGPMAGVGLLPARGAYTMTYKLVGTRRGFYRLGDIVLTGGDPLGWRTMEKVCEGDAADAVTVYPPITRLTELPLPNIRPFGHKRDQLRANEDPTRLAGVRDYQPGDSLRRIHWRATAKCQTLQVKEFIPTVTAEGLIMLNLGENEYPRGAWWDLGELAVETAASLTACLLRQEMSFGLMATGLDPEQPGQDRFMLPPAAGTGQAEAILTLLARVAVAPAPDFAELAGLYGRETGWGACLFLITPCWHEALARNVLTLRRLGKRPVILLLDKSHAAAAAATDLPVYCLSRDRLRGGVRIGHGG